MENLTLKGLEIRHALGHLGREDFVLVVPPSNGHAKAWQVLTAGMLIGSGWIGNVIISTAWQQAVEAPIIVGDTSGIMLPDGFSVGAVTIGDGDIRDVWAAVCNCPWYDEGYAERQLIPLLERMNGDDSFSMVLESKALADGFMPAAKMAHRAIEAMME